MAIENFKEIEDYFTTNKDSEDVKNFRSSILNVDNVKSFLENNEDGKKYINSYADTRVSKGIETFKQNNLQKLINDEIAKRNPSTDPKDKALADLQKEMERMKAESARKDLTNKALKVAQEKKIPSDLINFFVGQDEESTKNNLSVLEKALETYSQKAKEEILKSGSYTPPKSNNITTQEQAENEIYKYFGLGK
ncbi:DUF4355 domain-containing protein [Clostridium scatologenes]|uniref:DUF4355 domain-containing protein n=1 Tax=Clostridium scatologenes TaxID=1548 RepID=A0A0E3GSF2_CLOSL|nr:DUF4355 domain-containing protein [Clostridium scatologenes]AKA71966.1 hypothetical protein CSCA_4841 [Clostridium scatologenes]